MTLLVWRIFPRVWAGAELNLPAQEHAEVTDVKLKALYKVGTTGVEKIISSSQSWLQADKKDIQILSFRPKGLYGTMCHLDLLAHFVVPGFIRLHERAHKLMASMG